MIELKVIKDFTAYPGGRSREVGDNSAEEFYEDVLLPKYKEAKEEGCKLSIDFDGAAGYAGSFIDEAFGRLGHEFGYDDVKSRLIMISIEDKYLPTEILQSIAEWSKDGIHYNSPLSEDIKLKESNYLTSIKNIKK